MGRRRLVTERRRSGCRSATALRDAARRLMRKLFPADAPEPNEERFAATFQRVCERLGGHIVATFPEEGAAQRMDGLPVTVRTRVAWFRGEAEDALLTALYFPDDDDFELLADGDRDWPEAFDDYVLPIIDELCAIEARIELSMPPPASLH